jgi:hypothetical protein
MPLFSIAIMILPLFFRVCDFTLVLLKIQQHVTPDLDGQFDGVKSVMMRRYIPLFVIAYLPYFYALKCVFIPVLD